MIFNNTPKVKVVKLPSKPNYIRVIHGDYVDNLSIDYQAYDNLVELRAVLMEVFNYVGLGEVNAYFGGGHFAILINNKEVLRVADVAYFVGDDE